MRRAWDRFWFASVSARPLGTLRIAYGLIVLGNLALLAPELDEWLTDAGRLQGGEARELAGPLRWSILQSVQDPTSVRLFVVATAVVAVLFTLGWRTRVVGVLLYLANLSIHHRNLLATNGADVLLVVLGFYLMLSPCGAAYSLDARRRWKVPVEPIVPAWPLRLIAIQVSVVYFMTAWLKARGGTWADGTALHYVLSNAEFRRFTFGLTDRPLMTAALTHATLILEFALPFLLWVRAARPWAIGAGIGLHLGIGLTVNIPIFGELMVASYLAFLTSEEFDVIVRRIKPRLREERPGRVDGPETRLRGPRGRSSWRARTLPGRTSTPSVESES